MIEARLLAPGFWDDQQHAAVGDRRSRQARSRRDLARSGSLGGAGGEFSEVNEAMPHCRFQP